MSQQLQLAQPVQTKPCSPDIPRAPAQPWGRSGAATGRAGWPRCFPSMAGARLLSSLHVTALCIFSFHSHTLVFLCCGEGICAWRAVLGCSCSGCPLSILRCDTGAAVGACGALSKAVDALSGLGSSAVAARNTGRALGGLDPPPAVPHPNQTCPTPGKAQAAAGTFSAQLLVPGSPHSHCHVSQTQPCLPKQGKRTPLGHGIPDPGGAFPTIR